MEQAFKGFGILITIFAIHASLGCNALTAVDTASNGQSSDSDAPRIGSGAKTVFEGTWQKLCTPDAPMSATHHFRNNLQTTIITFGGIDCENLNLSLWMEAEIKKVVDNGQQGDLNTFKVDFNKTYKLKITKGFQYIDPSEFCLPPDAKENVVYTVDPSECDLGGGYSLLGLSPTADQLYPPDTETGEGANPSDRPTTLDETMVIPRVSY